MTETLRLEDLWAGRFGYQYLERNIDAGDGREAFWSYLLDRIQPASVLEVGCNAGANLCHIAELVPAEAVYGVDINRSALHMLRRRVDVNAVWGRARELPFRDRMFDLVFTAGVLIHQPEETLPLVMGEIVRTSRRYVLAMEYTADAPTGIDYRGERGALFKRDFGSLYSELFPKLQMVDSGFLGGVWDDVTWWLFDSGN